MTINRSPFHSVARLAAAALAIAALGGCRPAAAPAGGSPASRKITFGVSLLNLSSEFIVQLNRTMQAEADRLGIALIVNDAERSADKQIQQVEGFAAEKVDVVILNPCEVDGSSPAVTAAIEAGIPIVNVNSETRATPTAFVGSRDEDSGRMAMEYIAGRLHGKGAVVMMEGYMGQAAQIKRDQGARDVIARNPGMKLIAVQTADWDRAKAISLMENWIESYRGGIDAVFAQNDEMAMGAVLALEQAGLKSKVVVAGVDGISDALAAVKAGRLDATVFQDALGQGRTAVDVAAAIYRHQPYAKETLIPFQLVTRDNISKFVP
jgi:inositol transport system substrate-binding protein